MAAAKAVPAAAAPPVAPVADPKLVIPGQGQMFAATVAQALGDSAVVAGTVLVGSINATVLFDSGCTHTFVTPRFAKSLALPIVDLGFTLEVTTPSGQVNASGQVIRNVNVQVQHNLLSANLILFSMNEFDIIFGMDWMSKNKAIIDTWKKKVYFRVGKKRCVFQGVGRAIASKFFGYQHIKRYVNSGAELFMAMFMSSMTKEKSVDDVPVVKLLTDVFPDDIPGLPPAREVEFVIDLIPGTAPISRAPYRMTPLELKELKAQLEELLKQGFV